MAFHRKEASVSISRRPGIRHVTACVGGRGGAGIVVGNCTSPRKDTRVGTHVTGRHTSTMGRVLVGECGVSTGHVGSRKRNINGVFRRPS